MSPARPAERQVFISFARGISMLSIVLYHLLINVPKPPLLVKANQIGGSGIYVFLFASSYGLYYSSTASWGAFYRKRFQKVLLPYYIAITLIFILNLFLAIYPAGWGAYLSHIFLYKMFSEAYMESFGPHFWFVSTIVQFYLLWPGLLVLARRLSTARLLLVAFGISLAYSILIFKLGVQQERIWCSSAIQYGWILALGLAAAQQQWMGRYLGLGAVRHALLLVVGLAVAAAISSFAGPAGNVFNDYFMFIAYFSGCVLLFLLGQRIPVLVRFVLWVESFSYSLYLIHLLVFSLYLKALGQLEIHLYEVPIVLALCFGLALLFDKAVNYLTAWRPGPAHKLAKS